MVVSLGQKNYMLKQMFLYVVRFEKTGWTAVFTVSTYISIQAVLALPLKNYVFSWQLVGGMKQTCNVFKKNFVYLWSIYNVPLIHSLI